MSGLNKGLGKIEVALKWDPSPSGEPPNDLDIVAGTYRAADPYGEPAYLVHFDSRSPDGTIYLNRDSRTGQGLGTDEAMTLEFERLSEEYSRVVVGVAIQQNAGRKTFGDVRNTSVRIVEGYTELMEGDFTGVPGATAATVAEFTRDEAGEWGIHSVIRGFDVDPEAFTDVMGKDYS
ncbi:putative bacterial stress protein [Streptomyces himastatinicus ATCC 53653]|uniref:Putative bacterial stress protein n=1 Tax=Streptomyces himastatinicus ATCC 53653 TaxID=457427 RepID=D9W7H7_9ACTN|nr:TerD family protein [Streptomyces himastatinicus]EFL28757.1 putative bacterial stress protein [Streptomyces himastatinicus ATCC 53653]